jgi:hypothetical protein
MRDTASAKSGSWMGEGHSGPSLGMESGEMYPVGQMRKVEFDQHGQTIAAVLPFQFALTSPRCNGPTLNDRCMARFGPWRMGRSRRRGGGGEGTSVDLGPGHVPPSYLRFAARCDSICTTA